MSISGHRIGPQKKGGRYFCGYWGDEYTVIEIEPDLPDRVRMMTVEWSDGHRTTHCTAWDERKDRVIEQPTA